jgi:hypothetical protein
MLRADKNRNGSTSEVRIDQAIDHVPNCLHHEVLPCDRAKMQEGTLYEGNATGCKEILQAARRAPRIKLEEREPPLVLVAAILSISKGGEMLENSEKAGRSKAIAPRQLWRLHVIESANSGRVSGP